MKNALTKKEKEQRGTQQSHRQKKLEKKQNQIISRKRREIIVQPRVLAAKCAKMKVGEKGPKESERTFFPPEHFRQPEKRLHRNIRKRFPTLIYFLEKNLNYCR